jgi:hypothetical protein
MSVKEVSWSDEDEKKYNESKKPRIPYHNHNKIMEFLKVDGISVGEVFRNLKQLPNMADFNGESNEN